MKITIEKKPGVLGWRVECGLLYAEDLMIDEALAAVVSQMFANHDKPLHLKPKEESAAAPESFDPCPGDLF